MLKSDGFYMAELMLSLAGWLLIAGFFVPYIIYVKKQTIQVEEQSQAYHLLYETMQTVLIEHPGAVNSTVIKGGTTYKIIWQEGAREICIRYEDIFEQNNQLCGEIP